MFGSAVRSLVRPGRRPARGRRPLAVEALDDASRPAVDQVYDPTRAHRSSSAPAWAASTRTSSEAQTFTVGRTGVLTEVDVYVFRFYHNTDHGDLILDLRALQPDGRPTSNSGGVLLSATIPATSVPEQTYGFVPFDLSGFNFQVTQGEQLAIVLHVAPDQLGDVTYQWDGGSNNPVPGRRLLRADDRQLRLGRQHRRISDLGFRTWVDAPAQAPPVVTLAGRAGPLRRRRPARRAVPQRHRHRPRLAGLRHRHPDRVVRDQRHRGRPAGHPQRGDGRRPDRGAAGQHHHFGGTTIGTFAAGNNGFPLTITLNASADVAATQALVRNLTFGNVSGSPFTGDRTIQVVLTDGDGGTSAAATTTVTVSAGEPAARPDHQLRPDGRRGRVGRDQPV